MAEHGKTNQGRAGQRAALILAGTGVFWVVANLVGTEYDWPIRVRALFDLAALAGFGFALWQTFQLWRVRQDDKGDS